MLILQTVYILCSQVRDPKNKKMQIYIPSVIRTRRIVTIDFCCRFY